MKPTDLQLQLALAKELPELISIVQPGNDIILFRWISRDHDDDDYYWISHQEWDWIVNEVIKNKYTKHSCYSFFDELGIMASEDTADCDGKYEYQGDGSYYEQWLIWNTTWQQRAIAYFKSIGKEI